MQQNQNRNEIIEKIRAMRAKASDAAATEAEAMQAAAMAAKMMAKHEISEADLRKLEREGDGITTDGIDKGRRNLHPTVKFCANAVADLTETKGWRKAGEVVFAGLDQDVEFALYLMELIRGAAERAWSDYRKEDPEHARENGVRKSYLIGFGVRCAERLRELAEERRAARHEAGGTALVVRKDALIKRHLADNNVRIERTRARKTSVNSDVYRSGRTAAARLNLSRPVPGSPRAAAGSLR